MFLMRLGHENFVLAVLAAACLSHPKAAAVDRFGSVLRCDRVSVKSLAERRGQISASSGHATQAKIELDTDRLFGGQE